ncbi:MAG: hypothetical protein QOD84_1336 [Acidobacteriaceae bacterium]|jgi:hypothetical protein
MQRTVPFLRRKIVFDTQIISKVQSGTICSADWSAALKYISTRCKYAISLNTLYELLAALANGSEQYFEANQERIKILYSPRGREILPLVGDFVRSRIFGLSARRREFAPGQLKVWVEVVLAAKSKSDLQNVRVRITRPGHSNKSYGFDLPLLMSQINEGKEHDARRLEQLREGDLLRSTASTWTNATLNLMGIPETARNAEKLLAALDAASLRATSTISVVTALIGLIRNSSIILPTHRYE